jgi:hypothetical protein
MKQAAHQHITLKLHLQVIHLHHNPIIQQHLPLLVLQLNGKQVIVV